MNNILKCRVEEMAMSILIEEIRIRNFKSYKNADLKIKDSTLLLGANNAGKTALLEALELCFIRYKRVSEDLVNISKGESIPLDREIILDVLISSTKEEFADEWFELFGSLIIEDQFDDKQVVALRTIIKYNSLKDEYELQRVAMNMWPSPDQVIEFKDYNTSLVTNDIIESIPVFYLDAKRDISSEVADKYSYWGKLVKDVNLSPDKMERVEQVLNEINDEIIGESSVLKHLTSSLNEITEVLDSNDSNVEINPVTRKIKDLNKGMEIKFSDQNSESFSINNQGMGTKSWITFLTLSAYISWKINEMKENSIPYHPLLLLEEPEAHLHPQAQRKIYKQMKSLEGQKLISTHSPIIAAQASLDEIIHIYKDDGLSNISNIETENLSEDEERKINKEILKSRGDILFADALILGEGDTEEQILPPFFEKYFEKEVFELGVNIVGVGGFRNYIPFMTIARDLGIEMFILSDGEENVIETVTKNFREIYGDINIEDYVKFLPNFSAMEQYLLEDGYFTEIDKVLKKLKGKDDYLERYIQNSGKSKPDFDGEAGRQKAIVKNMKSMKTEYSLILAREILTREDETKIPRLIRELFDSLAFRKGYKVSKEFE